MEPSEDSVDAIQASALGSTLALVHRAVAKEPAAVLALVKLLGPVVYGRVAKALFRRRGAQSSGRDVSQEVEDLAQEVFLELFAHDARTLRAWDPARSPLGAFVALIADHHVHSVFRSSKRRPWSNDLDILEDPDAYAAQSTDAEAALASAETLDWLLDRLRAELSPKGFDVFTRLYVREQSIETVAQELSMTADALYAWRSRLSALVRKLATVAADELKMSDVAAARRTSMRETL
jgi:RNA polymerase sigma factor (sigma-70 family)